TNLQEVAQMMMDADCGEIPIVDGENKPVGVVTDRDIVCRAVAQGRNPLKLTATDCMSEPCITVPSDMSIEDCCDVLEDNQIRRVPVIDDRGVCCGIVSQADIARHHLKDEIVEVLEEVSQPQKV
ncbi:MAG: CBS domain-containing protein, partial [Candidatus Omnitrophica bacterium]|nr:CBS domain-containing protein [Candidatus Omnitrophota bacterium]